MRLKFLLIPFLIATLFVGSAQAGGNFYWKDTYAALDGIADSAGDRGIVADSSGNVTFYHNDGAGWIVDFYIGKIGILSNDTSLSTTEVLGQLDIITGTGTVTLPSAVAGMNVCIYNSTAATTYIDPDSTDVIVLNGTALTGGYRINNNPTVAGDFICLVSDTANQWRTMGRSGTWESSGS